MPARPRFSGAAVAALLTLACLPSAAGQVQPPASLTAPAAPPAPAPAPATVPVPGIEASVVKVFATARYPDPYRPWTKQAPREGTGTGVIIEGRRILTNAHVVLYASQVQVQANQSGDKVSATVEAIAPGIDLAVLRLEDESFFAQRPALPRAARLPGVKDPVMVYGFPTGGTNLSITKGIVSRIEFTLYNYPVSGLRIQIDAAINPGNSGGPAVVDDRMIGLAFSRLGGGDNIGYIIPAEEIDLFLADVADGRYDGKPALFDPLQTFENPALRTHLKVGREVEGVIVTGVDNAEEGYPLRPWDVLTHIAGTPIDNEGMVRRGDLRVRLHYLLQSQAKAGRIALTVVRDQTPRVLEVPVPPQRPLVMPDLVGNYPSYFIYGPVVFSAATQAFLAGLNNVAAQLSAQASPLAHRRADRPAFAGEEIVVVSSPFFPHRLVKGYSPAQGRVVESVNGRRVRNLAHLVELLRDAREELIVLDFAGRKIETVVLPRAETAAATEDILNDNGIRAQGSPDVLAVWQASRAP
jgi:S1-C subfamily serine protease